MKQIRPQLSHSLELNQEPDEDYFKKNRLKGSWFMSEKFDGIRAIWNGKQLVTRVGRQFRYVPKWFLELLPKGFPLDGELIVPQEEFGYFSSITVQKESESAEAKWKRIKYRIFDTPQGGIPFENRLTLLRTNVPQLDSEFIELIEFKLIEDIAKEFDKVNQEFKKIVDNDGEGVMLIRAKSNYNHGKRSRDSLKYKKRHEGEARVLHFHEGKHKYKGMLGKIECKLPNGRKFCCGSGLTDAQRAAYVFKDKVLLSHDKTVPGCPEAGDIITYSCMEIIKKTKVPRMAVYKGVRTDLN